MCEHRAQKSQYLLCELSTLNGLSLDLKMGTKDLTLQALSRHAIEGGSQKMVQGIRCLLCQPEDLSLTLEPTRQAKHVGTHQCWEVETGGSLKLLA